jgi:hypothetical protein
MKPFALAAAIIFALMAIVHILRIIFGWSIAINGTDIPMWVSVVAFLVMAGLAFGLWRESQ